MEKLLLFAASLLISTGAVRAQALVDLSTARVSGERKAILDALRPAISKEAGTPVSFILDHLKVQGAWAFMHGTTRRADGGDVEWNRSPGYAELTKKGMFDSPGTAALLKKVGEKCKRVVHVIGPADVAWTCW